MMLRWKCSSIIFLFGYNHLLHKSYLQAEANVETTQFEYLEIMFLIYGFPVHFFVEYSTFTYLSL